MTAGHDEHDREETGDGERVLRDAGPARPAIGGCEDSVEVLGDAVGIDDGDQAVDQDPEIDHEDGIEHGRIDEQPEQRDPVETQDRPGAQGKGEDGRGRECEGTHRRTGVQMPESREDQGEECRREGRPRAPSRALRFVHRG